jgi:hypothetical protein
MSAGALEALERVLEGGGEPDDVLRAAVDVLAADPDIAWAAVAFLEEGLLVQGPASGEADEGSRRSVPVLYQGAPVGELRVDGDVGPAFLERAAALLSTHVLVGWDTGGERWQA